MITRKPHPLKGRKKSAATIAKMRKSQQLRAMLKRGLVNQNDPDSVKLGSWVAAHDEVGTARVTPTLADAITALKIASQYMGETQAVAVAYVRLATTMLESML